MLTSAVLPTLSVHLLQKLPLPIPHLNRNPSGHLLHLLKPNEHTGASGHGRELATRGPRTGHGPTTPKQIFRVPDTVTLLWQHLEGQI